ncbi:MAG: hypothetical protein JST01_27935 [Cyanobacteria bacterium SZAS TMP-1]|nr:hypothetical protein [Cyanobacteria bacterium SZAS TMP-1]
MIEQSEEPHISVGVLKLWIFGPPSAEDWIDVIAVCRAPSATIRTSGHILQTADLRSWLRQIESMNRALVGTAILNGAEPNLSLRLQMDRLGIVEGQLDITPDVLTQVHQVRFEIDQSYLPSIISQTKAVIKKLEDSEP